MKKIFMTTLSTLALTAGAALAQDDGLRMAEFLAQYPEANAETYVEADLNSDGIIDDVELRAAMDDGLIVPMDTAPMDTATSTTEPVGTPNTDVPPTRGADEGLTMAEFLESYPEATESSYVEADLNSDGVIDNAELLAATEAGLILPVENTAPVGTGVTSVTTTAPDVNLGSEPDVPPTRGADEGLRMAEFLEEYPNATEETYVEADLDADGRIDNAEILAATEAGLIMAKAD